MLGHAQLNTATKHLLHFAHDGQIGERDHLQGNATAVPLTQST